MPFLLGARALWKDPTVTFISFLHDWLAILIALIALFISWISFRRTGPLLELQKDLASRQLLEKKKEALAKQKADVRITLERVQNGGKFVLKNFGPALAYDVNLKIEPAPREKTNAGKGST